MNPSEYITARKSQLKYYRDVALFNKIEGKGFVLYKKAGITLSDMRLDYGSHPEILYIRQADKLSGLREAQKGFNAELENYIKSDNPGKVRETVVNVVKETLTEPRSGSLEGISDTVGILVGDCVKDSNVVKNLIDMTLTDYSIILHSINVMAFALGFASHMHYSQEQAKELGLCALLHDVGKTKINQDLLAAPRKLTDEEFDQIKSHTWIGFRILGECRFAGRNIALTALEHHEKMDGSGYPQGKTRICEPAKIVGLIDCYEALTTDERPYREALVPFDTLEAVIGTEVNAGKYDRDIYVEFVKSLGTMSIPANLGIGNSGRKGTFQIGSMT
jgi:HD-GYP domain-containing protein (c-di-GMP phosphodiesterase class II)